MADNETITAPVVEQKPNSAAVTDDELADLRAQVEQANREKDAEKRRADAAEARAAGDRGRARSEADARFKAEEDATESALAAASLEAARLEGDVARLQEEGKFAEAAKAMRELAKAQYQVETLSGKKEWLADQRKQAEAAPTGTARERFLSSRTPKTRAFLEAHPDLVTDEGQPSRDALKAHYSALAEGLAEDTPDYFAHVETKLGLRDAAENEIDPNEEVRVEKPAPRTPPRASTAAPPSRAGAASGGSGRQANSTTIKLTPSEQDAAIASFPDMKPEEAYAEYGKNLAALVKEGKVTRQLH